MNDLLRYSCDTRSKQSHDGCRIMICHPQEAGSDSAQGLKRETLSILALNSRTVGCGQPCCRIFTAAPGKIKPGREFSQGKALSLSCRHLGVSKMPFKGHPFEFISSLPSAVAMKNIRTELRIILRYIIGRLNSALEASQFPEDFPGDQNQCSPQTVTSVPVQ